MTANTFESANRAPRVMDAANPLRSSKMTSRMNVSRFSIQLRKVSRIGRHCGKSKLQIPSSKFQEKAEICCAPDSGQRKEISGGMKTSGRPRFTSGELA